MKICKRSAYGKAVIYRCTAILKLTRVHTLFQVTDLHFIYTDEEGGDEVNALRERYSHVNMLDIGVVRKITLIPEE